MFQKDINRTINGVIQVEQENLEVIKQEVSEYVVTSELKKHFNAFFKEYSKSFDEPTNNIGVWITGFFGSGKSHFLKMLSYLLENKEIEGKSTVEYFREKYDDELSFMNIEKSTQAPTETILFNIDVEGSINKDNTAVLKVFARTFYDHLGFCGSDLKVAKMEQHLTKRGKMQEFIKAFNELTCDDWFECRGSFAFYEDDVIKALQQSLGMSEESARNWVDSPENIEFSIKQLVEDIKAYVDTKPEGFRLLFMIDEVGQYVGTDRSLLLNLQSITEEIGSACRGKVWIVATGQEALDEIIKVRTDEFSRIMARFNIKLSLTSSSVGEVIEKRLLNKTDEAYENLSMVYDNNANVLSNLYSLQVQKKDLKGFTSPDQFARMFPFVPYQFIIMKDVFNQIRKKGHAGKHHSSGERSMLNGFQESAQKIQKRDEFSVVPMYYFYDTIHGSLDTSIRSVMERAERAAENNEGLTVADVNLLKVLYLIRYIDDIPSNVENLTILMADDIRTDKKILREDINKSLDRLDNQNYISRNGDQYMFLTDEEQDIARDIRNTDVDTSAIVDSLGKIIFNDIYTSKKFKYGKYDFEFNQSIDDKNIGNTYGDAMKLRFMTVAADPQELQDMHLITTSKNNEAICVLADEFTYFSSLETAEKIRKYAKGGYSDKPESVQKIIQEKLNEARRLEKDVKDLLEKAIVNGKFYIGGEIVQPAGSKATDKINNALEKLVGHTYRELYKINEHYSSDADIETILKQNNVVMDGFKPNQDAIEDIKNYLIMQKERNLRTSTYDINERYSKVPYGWRNIDIAGVLATMVVDGNIVIKYAGEIKSVDHPKMVAFLRNKSADGNVIVDLKEMVDERKLKDARNFAKEYFNVMDVPSEEDDAVKFLLSKFEEEKNQLDLYKSYNQKRNYPGLNIINEGLELLDEVFTARRDNKALIDTILKLEDDLLDNKEDLKKVEEFYNSQFTLYKNADEVRREFFDNLAYYEDNSDAMEAYNLISDIVTYKDNYNYSRIPKLNDAISVINDVKLELLKNKKQELFELIDGCLEALNDKAKEDEEKLADILNSAKDEFDSKRADIENSSSLLNLGAYEMMIIKVKDKFITQIEEALKPVEKAIAQEDVQQSKVEEKKEVEVKPAPLKIRSLNRQVVFDTARLESEEDIDRYLRDVRERLVNALKGNDGVIIK